MKLAQRMEKVSSSQTLEITSLAKKMKAQGKRIINFAAGEPDFDTPEYIKEAAIEAIRKGLTKYTPATGIPQLKEAIARKLKEDNHLNYLPSQIVVCSGAKHALYNLLQVLCEKGDEVVFSSPYWLSYPEMVTLAQARARIITTTAENNFKLDKDLLNRNISRRTKVIILNSPANPTGIIYSRQELEALAQVIIKRNVYVISDEIYEKLIFDGNVHVSIAALNNELFKRTVVVNGVSKSYAMTGWRIGYFASANQEIVEAAANLQSHSTSNPCSISQMAACCALANSNSNQIDEMVREFQLRRDCMLSGLNAIPRVSYIKPAGAFYVFCNIAKTGLNSLTFTQRLIQEAEIAAIAGRAFGRDDYVRLSFATSRPEIEEGMSRLKGWIEKL